MNGIAIPPEALHDPVPPMPVSMIPALDRTVVEMTRAWDISEECAENVIREFLFQGSLEIRRGHRIELEHIGAFEMTPKRTTLPYLIYTPDRGLAEPLPEPLNTPEELSA